jgi:replicative DNA helicase
MEPVRLPPHDFDAEEAVLGSLLIHTPESHDIEWVLARIPDVTEAQREAAKKLQKDYREYCCAPVQRVLARLKPEDFYRDRHGWIYAAIQGLSRIQSSVNQITVTHALEVRGKLKACGGAAYLSHLIAITPTSIFIEDYAQIVHECAQKRGLIGKGRQLEEQGYSMKPLPPEKAKGVGITKLPPKER